MQKKDLRMLKLMELAQMVVCTNCGEFKKCPAVKWIEPVTADIAAMLNEEEYLNAMLLLVDKINHDIEIVRAYGNATQLKRDLSILQSYKNEILGETPIPIS